MRRLLSYAVVCWLIPSPAAQASPPAVIEEIQQPAPSVVLRGRVLDTTGAAIVGAHVTVTPDSVGQAGSAMTDQQGGFEIAAIPGGCIVGVSANGFVEASRRITL